jgi:hypothetical protein
VAFDPVEGPEPLGLEGEEGEAEQVGLGLDEAGQEVRSEGLGLGERQPIRVVILRGTGEAHDPGHGTRPPPLGQTRIMKFLRESSLNSGLSKPLREIKS